MLEWQSGTGRVRKQAKTVSVGQKRAVRVCSRVLLVSRRRGIRQFGYSHRQHQSQPASQSVSQVGRRVSGSPGVHTGSITVNQSGRKTGIRQSGCAHRQYHCQPVG